MMEGSNDLLAKYSKIATEYSKLRSHIPVLKKAVADEQTRSNELKEIVKTKDQLLRIVEAEADSLSFRNHMLTCRVQHLQSELHELIVKNHKKTNKSQGNTENHSVLDEEFIMKLEENARLRSDLYEVQSKHEAEVHILMCEVMKLTEELEKMKKPDTKDEGAIENKSQTDTNSRSNVTDSSNFVQLNNEDNCSNKSGTETWVKDSSENPVDYNPFEEDSLTGFENIKNEKSQWESQENSVRSIIQEALEKQLLQTQQLLQKTKCDYELLNSNYKSLETKCKDLEEKWMELSSKKNTSMMKGTINYIPDEEAQARELEIKRCYQHRIDLVTHENQMLKSKLTTFEKEVAVMKMRLETETNNCNELAIQLEAEKSSVRKVKDELSTTVDNYTAQLSAMSDHVAVQNDIIEKQKNSIEDLQFQVEKAGKKGKK